MRENRTYGSEGGETGQPVFPTPILPSSLRDVRALPSTYLYLLRRRTPE